MAFEMINKLGDSEFQLVRLLWGRGRVIKLLNFYTQFFLQETLPQKKYFTSTFLHAPYMFRLVGLM